jgi:hypothetical protein
MKNLIYSSSGSHSKKQFRVAFILFCILLISNKNSIAQCSYLQVTTDAAWYWACAYPNGTANIQDGTAYISFPLTSNDPNVQYYDYVVKSSTNVTGQHNCPYAGGCGGGQIYQEVILIDKLKLGSVTYTVTPYLGSCAGTPKDITVSVYPWVTITSPALSTNCDIPTGVVIPIQTDVSTPEMIFEITQFYNDNVIAPTHTYGKSVNIHLLDQSKHGEITYDIRPYIAGSLQKCSGQSKRITFRLSPSITLYTTNIARACPNLVSMNTGYEPQGSSQQGNYELYKDGTVQASGSFSYDGEIYNPYGTGPNFNLLPYGSGEYYFKCTNSDGCTAESARTNIIVNPVPSVVITSNGSSTTCQGSGLTLTAQINNAGIDRTYRYDWALNGIRINNNSSLASYVPTKSGSYSVTVYDDPGPCIITSNSIVVTINSNPSIPVITGDGVLCSSVSNILTVNYVTGVTTWSTGATTKTISVSKPGIYTVSVKDVNTGCSSVSLPFNVVENRSAITMLAPGLTNPCVANVVLEAPQSSSYTWYKNGQQIGIGSHSQQLNVTSSGSYYVKLSSTAQCPFTPSLDVTLLDISITGSSVYCAGGSTLLHAITNCTDCSYLWSNGNTSYITSVSTPGNYTVTITSPSMGCSKTSPSFSVQPFQNSGANISVSPYSCFSNGSQILTLTPSITGTQYAWSTGATTRTINITRPETYTVSIVNTTGTSKACIFVSGCYVRRSSQTDLSDVPEEISPEENFSAYPNPADKLLSLKIPPYLACDSEFKVVNSYGEIVLEGVINKDEIKEINVENFSQGMYYILLENNNHLIEKTKIVVMHSNNQK